MNRYLRAIPRHPGNGIVIVLVAATTLAGAHAGFKGCLFGFAVSTILYLPMWLCGLASTAKYGLPAAAGECPQPDTREG